MTHIIVHRTHPVQYYGVRLLLLLFAALLLWGAFELGYMQSEEDIIKAKGGRKSLLVQQSVLKKKNIELSKEVLHLERQYLLEQKSCQLVQKNINQELQKIAQLEKELAFYKGIMSATHKPESIYLQSLKILPYRKSPQELSSGLFQYHFTIAQNSKKRTYSKGTIKILIKANNGSKESELSLFSLRIDNKGKKITKDKTFKFSFKYFQNFNGIIRLPEGVLPDSVEVIISSKKKKSTIKLDSLSWSQTKGVTYVGQ